MLLETLKKTYERSKTWKFPAKKGTLVQNQYKLERLSNMVAHCLRIHQKETPIGSGTLAWLMSVIIYYWCMFSTQQKFQDFSCLDLGLICVTLETNKDKKSMWTWKPEELFGQISITVCLSLSIFFQFIKAILPHTEEEMWFVHKLRGWIVASLVFQKISASFIFPEHDKLNLVQQHY